MIKNCAASVIIISIILLVAACSSKPEIKIPEQIKKLENLTVIPPETEASHSIDFKRNAKFGETEDVIVGELTGVAVDSLGRVYIADESQNIIHVYKPNARYLRQIGSEGKGPGEFVDIASVVQDGQYLYGYDRDQDRLNVYSLDSLKYSYAIPLLRNDRNIEALSRRYPSSYYVFDDGKLLVGFSQPFGMRGLEEERNILYYVLNREGQVVSDTTIFTHQADENIINRENNGMIMVRPPYGREAILKVGDDDQLYTSWTEDFLIKIYDADGSYQKAIYYPYQQASLDINEILKKYESKRPKDIVRNADNPSTWPAINSIVVDDKSRIWVSTITDNKEIYQWWVISNEGDLQAKFQWPRNRTIEEIKEGNVYTQETDQETGVEQIVRYSIEMSETE